MEAISDTTERPRFRTDLVAQPLDVGGQRFIDVTDPDSGRTFRFYDVEYSIACAMDGARDIGRLVEWASEELGIQPTADELRTVISTLADLGYLADGVDDEGADMELGAAGGAPSAWRGAGGGAGDIELGAAGGRDAAAEGAGPAGTGEDEASFADLWEDRQRRDAAAAAAAAASARKETVTATPPPEGARKPGRLVPQIVDEEDGPTQIPPAMPMGDGDDVSVNLSQHLAIGTEDVKEAVRQSRVMQAVPQEEIEDGMTDLSGSAERRATVAASPGARRLVDEPSAPPVPPAKPERVAQAPRVPRPDAPKRPDVSARPAVEPAASASGGGARTAILLVLLVLALGAGAYYYFVVMKGDQSGPTRIDGTPKGTRGEGKPGPGERPGPQPGPAAPPSAALEEGTPAQIAVNAVADGVVAWLPPAGESVEAGAIVAKLKGYEKAEAELVKHKTRLEYYERELAKAQEKGNQGAIDANTAKVVEKKDLVAQAQKMLEGAVMLAPTAGTVEPAVELGAQVAAGAPVVKVTGLRSLHARFKGVTGSYEPGGACQVAAKTAPATKVACEVVAVEGKAVEVTVSPDAGLAAGTTIVLQ